jgi:hypothetical protein
VKTKWDVAWPSSYPILPTSLRLAGVKGRARDFPPQCGVGRAAMPGSTSSRIRKRSQGQSRRRPKRLHSFCSLTSLLIEWIAPLELIVSPPRSPAVLINVSQIWGCAPASKEARNRSTSDVPKVPSQTSTINYYWSTAASVQPTTWHITLEPLL